MTVPAMTYCGSPIRSAVLAGKRSEIKEVAATVVEASTKVVKASTVVPSAAEIIKIASIVTTKIHIESAAVPTTA